MPTPVDETDGWTLMGARTTTTRKKKHRHAIIHRHSARTHATRISHYKSFHRTYCVGSTPCSPFTLGEQQPPRKCMPTRRMVDENYNTAAVHAKNNFINTVKNSQWTGITFHGRSWYRDQSSRCFLGGFPKNKDFLRISCCFANLILLINFPRVLTFTGKSNIANPRNGASFNALTCASRS